MIFRATSRVDLSAAVACSSGSSLNLMTVGRTSSLTPAVASGVNSWRVVAGSAPVTPRPTPPASPQHWPRRQTPQLPTPPPESSSSMT